MGQCIVMARSAADGTPQPFNIVVETSYAPLARRQREQMIAGASMRTYVNTIRESRLSYAQLERILTGQSPCMCFQKSALESDPDRSQAKLYERLRDTGFDIPESI